MLLIGGALLEARERLTQETAAFVARGEGISLWLDPAHKPEPATRAHSAPHGATDFRWDGVEMRPYKEDERALYKTITRQVLFSDPEMAGELRYFEVAPGGFSTLERHEHMHARADPARQRALPGRRRGEVARDPRSRHRAADDLASVPRHQGRAARLPLHGQRRARQAATCRRRTTSRGCARIPRSRRSSTTSRHDREHDRPGALERRRARRRDRHAQPARGEQRL